MRVRRIDVAQTFNGLAHHMANCGRPAERCVSAKVTVNYFQACQAR
jgi:hypothetical protein